MSAPATSLVALGLALLAGSAHAEEAAESNGGGPGVRLANHEGIWTADGVRWESRVLLDGNPQEGDVLDLAWPLEQAPESPDVRRWIRDDDGRVVSAELSAGDAWVFLHGMQPEQEAAPPQVLRPPAFDGAGIHRVVLPDLVYRPSPGLDLDARLKRTTHASLDRQDRIRTDLALDGRRARPREHPVYFVVDGPLRRAEGLAGEVAVRGEVGHEVLFASTGVFGILVLGLLGITRLLNSRVMDDELKRDIDRYIETEFVSTPQPKVDRK